MKITEIAFVCYAVTSLKKARPFYEGALGLTATHSYVAPDGDHGMIEYDIGAGTLAIGCGAPMFQPGGSNVCVALEVEDFAAAVSRLKAQGVKFTMEPQDNPPCSMALIADPDNNPLMIHRRKPKA